MPHVIVKLWPGKTTSQKQLLSDAIVENVKTILGYGDEAVTVGFEEVSSADWFDQVYKNDIQDKWNMLTKKPGYGSGPNG